MKKPLFTDRTKLYIGGYQCYESGTCTLAPTIDNTDDRLNLGKSSLRTWPLIAFNNTVIPNYNSIIEPIDSRLTLSNLAQLIRATKVDGYTYFLLTDRTFIWAKCTPDGYIGTNGRLFHSGQYYCNAHLEEYPDWRAALPTLLIRLKKRLRDVRATGKTQRLAYDAYVNTQTTINKDRVVEIRANNKRFKGIAY